jgi:ABC-type oligopeptide transport system substrate-binding subunit
MLGPYWLASLTKSFLKDPVSKKMERELRYLQSISRLYIHVPTHTHMYTHAHAYWDQCQGREWVYSGAYKLKQCVCTYKAIRV